MKNENKVDFIEVIELFAHLVIHEIKNEIEVPKLNFLFKEKDMSIFYYVMKHPFVGQGFWCPDIKEEDIEVLKPENNKESEIPTIVVEDATLFFAYLTDLINSSVIFYAKHGIQKNARRLAILLLRRIWLRMGENDFANVEAFLNKQQEFVTNELFDEERFRKQVEKFYDENIYIQIGANETYDETFICAKITISEDDKKHELPEIYFGIDDENVCYIYAVQNGFNVCKNKKIQRLLYKLNSGVENPNVHPNKVYALVVFIKYLQEKGIEHIKFQKKQVLSYEYHKLLSEVAKKKYLNNNAEDIQEQMWNESWCSHIIDKADFIENAKTNEFYNLIDRMKYHIPEIKIINDSNSDVIDVYIPKVKVKTNKKRNVI